VAVVGLGAVFWGLDAADMVFLPVVNVFEAGLALAAGLRTPVVAGFVVADFVTGASFLTATGPLGVALGAAVGRGFLAAGAPTFFGAVLVDVVGLGAR
jgi:hypothetical protein